MGLHGTCKRSGYLHPGESVDKHHHLRRWKRILRFKTILSIHFLLAGRLATGFDFNTLAAVVGDPDHTPSLIQWHITEGTLPAGLSLSTTGQLTGTPTETLTTDITLEASYKGKVAKRAYPLSVFGGDIKIKQYPDIRYYEDGTYKEHL